MSSARTLGIHLSPGIRRRHLWTYLLVAMISSAYAGALSVLQPGLLQALAVDPGRQATLTGYLSALQELVFILSLGPIGALADRLGRRPVYVAGLLIAGCGYAIYGQAQNVTQLVALRLVVAIGCAATIGMMVTVIADYPSEADRGKANGLQGLAATLGAFIPPLLLPLPRLFTHLGFTELSAQSLTFAAAGSLGVLAAVVALVGLAPAVRNSSADRAPPLSVQLRQGLRSLRDPLVALACAAAFTSRGVLAITGAFMSLWLVQYGTGTLGLQASQAMAQLAMPRVLTIVTGALIGALLMGAVSDRIARHTAITVTTGLTACVYTALHWVNDPTASWVFILLALMGIAEIGSFVSSQALIGQQAPEAERGVVIGFFGVAGAFGILLGTSLGGIMFRQLGPTAPFALFGAVNAAVCIASLSLRRLVTSRPLAAT
jgi:MFS family permease